MLIMLTWEYCLGSCFAIETNFNTTDFFIADFHVKEDLVGDDGAAGILICQDKLDEEHKAEENCRKDGDTKHGGWINSRYVEGLRRGRVKCRTLLLLQGVSEILISTMLTGEETGDCRIPLTIEDKKKKSRSFPVCLGEAHGLTYSTSIYTYCPAPFQMVDRYNDGVIQCNIHSDSSPKKIGRDKQPDDDVWVKYDGEFGVVEMGPCKRTGNPTTRSHQKSSVSPEDPSSSEIGLLETSISF